MNFLNKFERIKHDKWVKIVVTQKMIDFFHTFLYYTTQIQRCKLRDINKYFSFLLGVIWILQQQNLLFIFIFRFYPLEFHQSIVSEIKQVLENG